MMMSLSRILALAAPFAAAEFLLPPPADMVALNKTAGFNVLIGGETLRRSYVALGPHFTTEVTQSYCALASAAAALNALPSVGAPVDPAYAPYAYWTQDVLAADDCVRKKAAFHSLKFGLARDELAAALTDCVDGVSVANYAAAPSWNASGDGLREILVDALRGNGRGHALANFERAGLGEAGAGGHWSPVAAYDGAGDRALVLDVARYKYPPTWVPIADLARAMVAPDPDGKRARGLLVLTPE